MPALVLVPSPLHASRAARRLCDAQGGVLFGPQVTTLDALAAALLAAAGDRRPVAPPLAERLLALAAGKEAGGPFAAADPGSGLAAALSSALAELRRGEVSPSAARRAAGSLDGAAAA
ncbi:MAG TPA: PD-(D/E)XK nuclease family protein, partial [Anaeromyxobacteraceae bacterium]|nr:PD-(D/E)XK nuclease family protein [Anaeromyxobacteraceae bacterium]